MGHMGIKLKFSVYSSPQLLSGTSSLFGVCCVGLLSFFFLPTTLCDLEQQDCGLNLSFNGYELLPLF